jgi:site-specific recombinase XerD
MARRIRSHNLETRTARLKLDPRKKPYTAQIAPGIQLAYRRNKGAGVWSVKAPFGLKKFAIADDLEDANGETVLTYWQALEKARTLARAGEGSSDRLITVSEAVDNYEADLAARGAQKDNTTAIRRNLPETLAAKPVALLTEKELRTWRNNIVKRGLKPASADRVARVFKAAMYLAASDDPRIINATAWKNGLTRLPDGETARNVILSDQTVNAVVRACYDDEHELGVLVETLACTGSRESQVLRLDVFDLQDDRDDPRLMMPSSRKGRNRKIQRKPLPIPPSFAAILRQAAAGRAPHARLLNKIRNLSDRFRTATKHLGLDPDATPYALRHSSIVRMLLNGLPVRVVASHHDTSVEMIEKHYSRHITDVSDTLTRRTLLDFEKSPSLAQAA